MAEIQLTSTYVTETCCNCGIAFAMPRDFYNQRREDHQYFYCPKGHGQYYTAESDKEILQRKNEELKKNLFEANDRVTYWFDRSESEKRSKAAYKAHHTILKKKIKKGQCPCCNQNFPDVAEHIKSSHPDYNKRMKVKKK